MSDQSAFLSPDGRFAMVRSSHVEALLGAETFAKVRDTKILVVGAGGIGCELRQSAFQYEQIVQRADRIVKNLVLVGFANIEIVSSRDLNADARADQSDRPRHDRSVEFESSIPVP